ncbi:hypothetical protein EA462_02695 [Natrarchaeobius halalkaliphilus]|uniref:Uncharacterized protein n=1 Tax=Natrarchaeobius halalkaliphilus TaxID=1679091 RepID=A0A3N6M9Z0_9EURY|nr:hypothetical protein [Natrarchaeobius halalkaliphilus]RQG93130.1 hypothetical protein EA462_02695 [Natrarchaeobius halalkaliphilus]
MPQPYRGRPPSVSRFTLSGGRVAVRIPRDGTHFSKLENGYPLSEEFLDHLAKDGVDAIVIDDGERSYVFDLYTYRQGNRIGHEPYPMKRVASLDDATVGLSAGETSLTGSDSDWEWVTDTDLRPPFDQSDASSSSVTHESPDEPGAE